MLPPGLPSPLPLVSHEQSVRLALTHQLFLFFPEETGLTAQYFQDQTADRYISTDPRSARPRTGSLTACCTCGALTGTIVMTEQERKLLRYLIFLLQCGYCLL